MVTFIILIIYSTKYTKVAGLGEIFTYTVLNTVSNSSIETYLTEVKTFFRHGKESFFIGTSKQATLAHVACILHE